MPEKDKYAALSNVTKNGPKKKKKKDTKPAKAGFDPLNPLSKADKAFIEEQPASSYKPMFDPSGISYNKKSGKSGSIDTKKNKPSSSYKPKFDPGKIYYDKETGESAPVEQKGKELDASGKEFFSTAQERLNPTATPNDPEENFLFTQEYKTDKKLKKIYATAEKKEKEGVGIRRSKDAVIRSNKDLAKWKTLMDESDTLNEDEEIEIDNEFADIDQSELAPEIKKASLKLRRDGIELTDSNINLEAEKIWKAKRKKDKIYSKRFDFMEELDGVDDNISEVLKEYKLNEQAIADVQTAKTVAKSNYIKQSIDDDYEKFLKIYDSLKPEGYKFTTQDEVNLENEKIQELDRIKSRSEDSIGMLGSLQLEYDGLADKSISLKDEVELFNKEWGWWKKNSLKLLKVGALTGNSLLGASAFVMDPFAYLLTGEENYFGKATAEQKKILDDGFAEIIPIRREVDDLESLGEFVGDELISQTPNLLAAWVSGGSSLGVSTFAGTQVVGQKYSDMLNEEKYGYYDKDGNLKLPDYSAAQIFIAPVWSGGSEFATAIAFGRMVGRAKNAILSKASSSELEIFRRGLDNSYRAISERLVKNTLENFAEEIPAELLNNMVQNYGDKTILNKDVDILDNSLDVLKSTAAISTVFGTTPHLAVAAFKTFMPKSNILELQKNSEEILSLMNNVDYTKLSADEKKAIDSRIELLNKKSNDILNKTTALFNANSPEDILNIYRSGKTLNEIRKEALTIQNSSSLDPVEKQKTIEALNEKFKAENAIYQKQLGQAYVVEQIHRRAVGDGIKNKILSFSDRKKATLDAKRSEALTRMANAELNEAGVTKFLSTEELIKNYEADPKNKKAIENIDKLIKNSLDNKVLGKDESLLYRKALIGEKINSYGQFYEANGTIILNKDAILIDKRFSTGKHEMLHRMVKGIASNMGDIGDALYKFVEQNHAGEKSFEKTEFFNRINQYNREANDRINARGKQMEYAEVVYAAGGISEKEFNAKVAEFKKENQYDINKAKEEVLTLLIEAMDRKDIVVGKAMNVRLDSNGDVLFEDAQDVFNFIVNYSNGYNKSQLTAEGKAVLTGKVKGSLITSTTTQTSGVKESKNLQTMFDRFEGNAKKMVNETLSKTPAGNYASSLNSSELGQELGGIVETITKRLYDPIPADNKEMLSRQEYKDALIGMAATLITNEFNPEKQTLDRFISSRLNLRANSLAKELGIESTQDQGGAGFKIEIDTNKTESSSSFDEDFLSDEEADSLLDAKEESTKQNESRTPKFTEALDLTIEIGGKPIIETLNDKIKRNISFAMKRYDEEISKNRTITPFVETLRMETQEDMYKDFKKYINSYPGGYIQFLTDKKKILLANYTTTYLAKHPIFRQGIEKRVNNQWTLPTLSKKSNGTIEYKWVDEKGNALKIDRDNAAGRGLTSGPEMIRRNKKINNILSTEEFVNYHFQDGGLRTKKKQNPEDAIARQLASEITLEVFQADLLAEGPLTKMFEERADLLGKVIADNTAQTLIKDLDRGLIKESKRISDEGQSIIVNNLGAVQRYLSKFGVNSVASRRFDEQLSNLNFSDEDRAAIIEWTESEYKKYFQKGKLREKYSGGKINLAKTAKSSDILMSNLLNKMSEPTSIARALGLDYPSVSFTGDNRQVAKGAIKKLVAFMVNPDMETTDKMTRKDAWITIIRWLGRSVANSSKTTNNTFDSLIGISQDLFDMIDPELRNNKEFDIMPVTGGKSIFFKDSNGEYKRITSPTEKTDAEQDTTEKTDTKQDTTGKTYSQQATAADISKAIKTGDLSNIKKKERDDQSDKSRETSVEIVEFLRSAFQAKVIDRKEVGLIMRGLLGSMNSPFKMAAKVEWVADVSSNKKISLDPKEWTYEHRPPTAVVANKAIEYILGEDVSIDSFEALLESSVVAIIPDVMDKAVNTRYRSKQIPIASGLSPVLTYYSMAPFSNDIYPLVNITNNSVVDINVFNTQLLGKINRGGIQLSNSKESKRGISVWDFDDTLARTSSNILFTAQDGTKGKLNAEEFAKNGEDLLNQGYTFDFSEFSKVMNGTKGPMFDTAIKRNNKFGNEHVYILTARPANSAVAIHEFLNGIGLDIRLENIIGLGNSAAQAKAAWVGEKVLEGYNDFYFADDAYKNVKAVQDILKSFDVKSDVVQAKIKESKRIDEDFNKIIEETKGVEAFKEFSGIVGKRRGASKGKFRFFIPPGAEDFQGLLYDLMGKGKKGEEHQQFFKKHLIEPYTFGVNQIMRTKNAIRREYGQLMKSFPKVKSKLEKQIPSKDFTYDQAIRVYLWDKAGIEIPGLTKRDQSKLVDLIKNDPELEQFSGLLSQISRQPDGWLKPTNHWDVDTVLSDLNNTTEGSNRKEFLSDFVENSKEMFSEKNLNKLRAIFGNNWVEAMEDSLFRMTNGTNRVIGSNRVVNGWNNWVNNSTGAIMFFNRRSAVLQLLSTFNYVNWSDNNPLKAAAAFANQKQYWSDFATIFNSPMMKERRGGLQMEVSESEIANAAATSKNKAKAVMSYILKIGFIPTQMADSFAIASGGATMYRNRVNTYKAEYIGEEGKLKRKYTDKEAEDKAFEDFSRTTNESQQSADPMLISQEQAGPLGRIILAFQNTTQQYMRLSKKSLRDLINGRGDWKTHVSKIVYYTAIQNVIFNALQNGIFALIPGFGDEDDEDFDEKGKKFTAKEIAERKQKQQDEKEGKMLNGVVDSILRGAGLYGAIAATTKNVLLKYMEIEAKEKGMKDYTPVVLDAINISPPIGSKVRKLNQAMKGRNYNREVIAKRGYEVTYDGKPNLSPAWLATGQATSAITNFPLDRIYDETNSMIEAFDTRNTALQRTVLALGWKDWTVGATNEENDLIKATAKKEKEDSKDKVKKESSKKRKSKVRKSKIRR